PGAEVADRVRGEVERVTETVRTDLQAARNDNLTAARQTREEIAGAVRELAESLQQRVAELRTTLDSRLQQTSEANRAAAAQNRTELQNALKDFRETLGKQLTDLTTRNEAKLEALRTTLETKLTQLQTDNEAKLERIRQTVDEKLHQTLEQRLGESFKLVSERLEQVHTGLGEMKSLAVGVGDLKKILSNVRTRGTWGEVQLGNLLEQTLTPEQFVRNFAPDENRPDRVEYAIKLPGRDVDGTPVWLPLDSKFPNEEYQRLLDAQERADVVAVEAASLALEQGIRAEAKKISEKYICPPTTTDFAILFLPTEGLFAEVLRRPGLSETLQRNYRVTISGPTTLTALLTSLQMGFRTLAIEQRSSEVWKVLGAVKAEFGKFGETLDKVQKKLNEASHTIEDAQRRSRAVERKLRPADELPVKEAAELLGLDNGSAAETGPIEEA
ncbi:MAG: DNA recombination protein RmuC, partial [Candidatus Acidoferrales bacterium]|nr:DNA recombination protein RmuC [Candidatus Acidoferrales bacterium]